MYVPYKAFYEYNYSSDYTLGFASCEMGLFDIRLKLFTRFFTNINQFKTKRKENPHMCMFIQMNVFR